MLLAADTSIDLEALAGAARIVLRLPGREPAVAVVEHREWIAGAERVVLRGRLEGRPGSVVSFAVGPDAASGFIQDAELGSWRVRPLGDDAGAVRHRVLQVDPARLPGCGGAAGAEDRAEPPGAPAAGPVACEDGSRIDVLVLYTPLARSAAGGHAAIRGEIDLAIANANLAYDNSGIGLEVRLVHVQETPYDESSNYSGHLARLADLDDGYMDEAHDLRDEHSADLVALLVADGENCGIAYLMPANDPSSQNRGFSVTTWYCAAGFVLAHEMGHNMGCCHAPGDGGGCTSGGLYPYSNGHRYFGDSGRRWRTVMAYAPGERIPHFSNPAVPYDGRPTGIPIEEPDAADNATTIEQTRWAISNYRVPRCVGDVLRDCVVNIGDVLKVLINWGQSGVPADQNEDGVVDFLDVLLVIEHWGPCAFE